MLFDGQSRQDVFHEKDLDIQIDQIDGPNRIATCVGVS
jgi:hypothetical protein